MAENGQTALYMARHEKPDLILLDGGLFWQRLNHGPAKYCYRLKILGRAFLPPNCRIFFIAFTGPTSRANRPKGSRAWAWRFSFTILLAAA